MRAARAGVPCGRSLGGGATAERVAFGVDGLGGGVDKLGKRLLGGVEKLAIEDNGEKVVYELSEVFGLAEALDAD